MRAHFDVPADRLRSQVYAAAPRTARPEGAPGRRPADRRRAWYGHPDHFCHRKRRYGRQRARRIARQLNDTQLEAVHAYPCPNCRRWHVGHTGI